MGFGFWGPKKGPKRAESELVDKVQDPRTPVVSIRFLYEFSCYDGDESYILTNVTRPTKYDL